MKAKGTTSVLVALWLTGLSAAGAQVSQQGSAHAIPRFNYANIAWGSSAEKVKAAMASQGLRFVEKTEDGDLVFKGSLMNQNVLAFAMIAHDSLLKIEIAFLTPDNEARAFYHQMIDVLKQQYGEPHDVTESFEPPYHDGDGHEQEAIQQGKALFLTGWGTNVEKTETMWVTISEYLTVVLAYETPGFIAESKLRKKRKSRGL